MNRAKDIEKLKTDSFDILVIGGGATGTGAALDAVSRGLKTALVERFDYASGTSSRSTKLLHGGVRYLEQAVKKRDAGQYKLVRDALHERSTLLKLAPHLARPLALVTPLYRRLDTPYYLAGLKLYDWLAGRQGLKKSHYVSAAQALAKFPMLKKEGLKGGVVYYDGQFDDARMNVSLALTASEQGATLANYVEVIQLLKKDGKLVGALVQDKETGDSFPIKAKVIINACGPFCDFVRKLDDPNASPMLTASSGIHIVLDRKFSPPDTGLLIPKTEDNRVLFLLPWQGHTLVGTTDNPAEIEPDPQVQVSDVDYILRQLKHYFAIKVTEKDILSRWSGLRPLVSQVKAHDTARLSRDHLVNVSASGLVTITGGKWTTYRKMALDGVSQAIRVGELKPLRPSLTEKIPLAGGENFKTSISSELQRKFKLDPDVCQHLMESYGSRAFEVAKLSEKYPVRLSKSHPYIEAEVIYAVRVEGARKVEDVLGRRTRLSFLDAEASRKATARVNELMKQELAL
ncbi:MAG: FAD-dependent oxidoreductase [Proteobacteria bacterium]|nr:FAD-dependent oxidoreductase [Pseudomonadota bacterium]NBY20654.1 FAD-dependent oxidoreductase [bacterium]